MLKELLKKDQFYGIAIRTIDNPKEETKQSKDPESMTMLNISTKVVDWNHVYENLKLSNQEYQNPISAFYGVYIINKFMGQQNRLDDYRSFSETLYLKEKNMCESFINYGAIFEKGYGGTVDYKKANDIYEEGLKKACKDGWQRQVVEAKLWYLKGKIKWLK